MLDYYKIFPEWEEEINMLDEAARGRLLSALMAYAFRGEKVTLTGEERLLYMPYCRAIDAMAQKAATNAANGAKGGKAKAKWKQHDTDSVANDSDGIANCSDSVADCGHNTNTKTKSKSKSKDLSPSNEGEGAKAPNARTREKFSPPTADEVKAYADDKGLVLDADRFVDFYAAKGWRVGTAPMKDWRAAARNWARDDDRRELSVFKPPHAGEVMSYALERGWARFDYNAFVNYYAARGWRINGTQITDWHPLAQTWWRKNNTDDLPY